MPKEFSDFNNKDYLEECVLICRETRGGFTKEYIDTLDYDEFLNLNIYCGKLQKGTPETENFE